MNEPPTSSSLAAPTAPGERYEIIDIVRGFALFGVLMSNIMWMCWVALNKEQRAELRIDGLDDSIEFLLNLLIEGKFYTLFSILFGLGFAVQLSRAADRGQSVVPTYMRRLAILLVIGVLHAVLLWFGDILHIYALLGFVLVLFRNRSDRVVLGWAIAIATLATLMPGLRWIATIVGAGDAELFGSGMTGAEQYTALINGGWQRIIRVNISVLREDYGAPILAIDGSLHWYLNVLSRFLFGFYIGRRMLLQHADRHLALFRRALPWALGIGLGGNLIAALSLPLLDTWIPAESSALALLWIPVEIGVIALSLAYLCGLVLLYQRPMGRRVLAWLAPLGRMALTNYLTHSACYVLLFYGVGLGLLGRVGLTACLALSVAIFAAQIVVSLWWLKRFRFGPMEWVWRWLTYGRRPAFRVRKATG